MESWRHQWRVETICRVMRVSPRGYRAWRSRPMSRRDRTDMKVLAHIREQYSLSLGSYGRPRMTMELKEAGLDVGERRVGRLMKINGSVGGDSAGGTIQSRAQSAPESTRLRRTARITLVSRRTGWTVILSRMRPIANGRATSPMSGRQKAGSTSLSFSICTAVVLWVGLPATG